MPATVQVEMLPAADAPGPLLRLWRQVPLLVGLVLPVLLLLTYANDPAVPGNHGRFPDGWWGWWDQSQYVLSARSLAAGDLRPDRHWYPIGYAMLGAPFTLLSRLHPYLLPDLVCPVIALAAFTRFSRAVGVGAAPAALLFLLATCGSDPIRAVWAEPWNTTLSAALIWGLLALTADHLCGDDRGRVRWFRMLAIGAIAGFMPVTRPTDALLVAIWAAGAGLCAIAWRRLVLSDLAGLLVGGLLSFGPSAGLWIAIHGTGPSQYMVNSAALGFDFGTLGWRTFLLLVAPQPWFPEGSGLLQTMSWLLPGIAGLLTLPWLLHGRARWLMVLLAAMILAYAALFFAYVDLIAPGLWKYNNVHYFKWMLPGVLLFGWVLLRALARGPWSGTPFRAALIGSLLALLIYGFRMDPHPVGDDAPAWMVQLHGPVPGWDESYFGHMTIRDARGEMHGINDFRALPDEQGWRLVALSRPFLGAMTVSGVGHWPDGPVAAAGPDGAVKRWGRGIGLRLPFHLGRRPPRP